MNKHFISLIILSVFLLEASVNYAFSFPQQTQEVYFNEASDHTSDFFQPVISSGGFTVKVNPDNDPVIAFDHWILRSSFQQKRIINGSFAPNYWQSSRFIILFPFHEFS